MQKNHKPQTTEDIFWIFTDFSGIMQSKVQLHKNFINSVAIPKTIYWMETLQLNWNHQKLNNKQQW